MRARVLWMGGSVPGTQGIFRRGKKKPSSLAAVSWLSLPWTAFSLALVPNLARRLLGRVPHSE
jgi:hypothetical protein